MLQGSGASKQALRYQCTYLTFCLHRSQSKRRRLNSFWQYQKLSSFSTVDGRDLVTTAPKPTTMRSTTSSSLLGAFRSLKIAHAPTTRPSIIPSVVAASRRSAVPQNVRLFSASASMAGNWLEPSLDRKKKMMKGRPRVPTGGSTKGTTVVWGEYGLRMIDHHRRISAKQLKVAEDTIKARLRGQKYRLYKRICCNVGVYVSGNEVCFSGIVTLFDRNSDREHYRCVWAKERVDSITGLPE
jgi:hypothetical protein